MLPLFLSLFIYFFFCFKNLSVPSTSLQPVNFVSFEKVVNLLQVNRTAAPTQAETEPTALASICLGLSWGSHLRSKRKLAGCGSILVTGPSTSSQIWAEIFLPASQCVFEHNSQTQHLSCCWSCFSSPIQFPCFSCLWRFSVILM